MRLVHITDPHLSSLDETSLLKLRGKRWLGYLSWQRRRKFIHLPEILDRLTGAVAAEAPDQVLVTGDLTQLGLPFELERAQRWLKSLGPPAGVIVVPGNHDVYRADSIPVMDERWRAYLHFAQHRPEGAKFPTVREFDSVVVVGVTSAYPAPWRKATGRVGKGQLERLDAVLGAHRDKFTCLLIHHPPTREVVPSRKALCDDDVLQALLRRHRVPLVLSGHIHRNAMVDTIGGVRMYTTASASSAASQHPASFRVFEIAATGTGWHVSMNLKELRSNQFEVTAADAWDVAADGPAQARSAPRA